MEPKEESQPYQLMKEEIQALLCDFKELINYPERLEVSEPYFPYLDHQEKQGKSHGKGAVSLKEYSDNPGVYIFCTSKKEKPYLYIGKSSTAIGYRVWKHIGKVGKTDDPFPDAAFWIKKHDGDDDIAVFTIGFKSEHWFMAAALEEFLIKKRGPTYNKIGKRDFDERQGP